MPERIWIETPDAGSAAFLMRDLVGRMRAQLVQCASLKWRVLVLADSGTALAVADVIALVRGWLSARGLRETTMHLEGRSFTVRGRDLAA